MNEFRLTIGLPPPLFNSSQAQVGNHQYQLRDCSKMQALRPHPQLIQQESRAADPESVYYKSLTCYLMICLGGHCCSISVSKMVPFHNTTLSRAWQPQTGKKLSFPKTIFILQIKEAVIVASDL